MVIFKSKQKKFEGNLKIKSCGKKLYPTESVKYLGVKTDTVVLPRLRILVLFNKFQFYKRKLLESLIENILFVSKSFNKLSPSIFNT